MTTPHPPDSDVLIVGAGPTGLTTALHLARAGRTGLLDTVTDEGFVLVTTDDPRVSLGAERLARLDALGVQVLHLVPTGGAGQDPYAAEDVDGTYIPHLGEVGWATVLCRPDHYIYGTAGSPADAAALVDGLDRALTAGRIAV